MYVGTQFEAPEGFGSFKKGIRYYFAGNRIETRCSVEMDSVLVVWFEKTAKRWQSWRVHLLMLSRDEFESALIDFPVRLKVLDKQFNLPPWLEGVDGVNFDEIEERRCTKSRKLDRVYENASDIAGKSNSSRQKVEMRLCKIAPALEQRCVILRSPDPLKSIAAMTCAKDVHPHRIQVWFFAFVLHGDNEWALKQPTHLNGLWSRREGVNAEKIYGRKAFAGSCYGWSSAPLRRDIVRYYLDRCGLGVTMRSIHRDVLRKEYKCVTVEDADGNARWVQPDNEPFPSYGQFRFVVVDELTLEFVQTQIYGSARMRQQSTSNKGNYTEQYANLLEAVEVDAYFVAERPRSLYSDAPVERLAVAEAVCVTSGAVIGVGFSLGSETGEAYRSMLFCMIAPKAYVAKLYGIPSDIVKWEIQGLPAHLISDRGPAGHRNLADRLEQAFPMKEIAVSYEGQSKAVSESTHPRDVRLEGAPSYVLSDLNVIQMVKRQFMLAAAKNHTKDISARLDDRVIRHFLDERRVATPHHYANYLAKRLRTSARHMSIEAGVRAFWTPYDFNVDKDGVKFRHRHFNSAQFMESGFLRKVGSIRGLQIRGYVLSLCLRYVWVEVEGRLIELEATQRVRVGDEEKNVPLSEFNETARQLATLKSKSRLAAEAEANKVEAACEKLIGIPFSKQRRRGGTPKKPSATVKLENKVAKGPSAKRNAA